MSSSRFATAFNVASAIVTLGVQMAVSFFLSGFLVATLGEEANGFTQLANNFVSYASLVTLAFNSMGQRFISTAFHRGELDKAGSYYSTLVVCDIALCAVFLPIAALVVGNLGSIVEMGNASLPDVQLLFAFVFANFGANLFVSLLCSAMFVMNRVYIQNAVNLARNVLNACVLLFLYATLEPHVHYVSLVSLALTVISIPVCAVIKSRLLPEVRFSFRAFSGAAVRGLTSSGIWNTVNQCGNMLMTGLDLLLANWFAGAGPMGLLSVAKTMPNAIITLASTLNSNLEPELVIAYAKGGTAGIIDRLRFDIRLSNLIVSVPIAVFCALSVPFYELWMPSLDAVELSALSFLTIMAYIPWAGLQVLYNVFTATNHLKVNSVAFCTGSVLNVALVLALLSCTDLGVYAIAGTSSAITIVRSLIVTAPYVAGLLGIRKRELYREVGISLACFVMVVCISTIAASIVGTSGWVHLVATIALSCLLGWLLVLLATFGSDGRKRAMRLASSAFHCKSKRRLKE